jgi:hypothetical protein
MATPLQANGQPGSLEFDNAYDNLTHGDFQECNSAWNWSCQPATGDRLGMRLAKESVLVRSYQFVWRILAFEAIRTTRGNAYDETSSVPAGNFNVCYRHG